MATYEVYDSELEKVADAIRDANGTEATLTFPNEFVSGINNVGVPAVNFDNEPYVRNPNYPHIEDLDLSNFYGMYLTYDLSKVNADECYISLEGKSINNSAYTVSRGHLENGAFVAETTTTVASGSRYYEALDSENGTIQLFQVSGTNQLRSVWFESPNANADIGIAARRQPCVERVCRLTNAILTAAFFVDESTVKNAYGWTTSLLERDIVYLDGASDKSPNAIGLYRNAVRLRYLKLSGFGGFAITTANSRFQYWFSGCFSLEELDLSGLQTTNWTANSIFGWFSCLYNLRKIKLPSMSNLALTSIESLFSNCYSLKEIDLSVLDTSNWAITNAQYMFKHCVNLRKIDMSSFDTSNWNVTLGNKIIEGCINLKEFKYNFTINAMTANGVGLMLYDSSASSGMYINNVGCPALSDFYIAQNSLGSTATGTTARGIDIRTWPMLSHDSMIRLFNGLAINTVDKAPQVNLTLEQAFKLSAAEKAIATEKGWTLVIPA